MARNTSASRLDYLAPKTLGTDDNSCKVLTILKLGAQPGLGEEKKCVAGNAHSHTIDIH